MNNQKINLDDARDLLHMSYWQTNGLDLKFSIETLTIVGKTVPKKYVLKEELDGTSIVSPDVRFKITDINQHQMTLDHEGTVFTLQKVS